jgi:hypothetical protein
MQQAADIQCANAISGSVSFKMLIVKLTLLTRRIRHQSRTSGSKTQRRYDRKTHCRPFDVTPRQECSNTRTEAAMHCDIRGFWLT